jgi:hypothetical protein
MRFFPQARHESDNPMIPDGNRSIFHTLAIVAALGWAFEAAPAAAQLAPWQQPPGAGQSDSSDPSGGSAPWASENDLQDGSPLGLCDGSMPELTYAFFHDRFWMRGEFLGWWSKGFSTPPLLTSSPSGTAAAQAGVLGAAGTSILFGGGALSGGFQPGERITLGAWLNRDQNLGIEASSFQLNRQTQYFNASGVTVPILARPIYNVQAGQQDSQLVNYPGQQSGTFSSAVASNLQLDEFLVRMNLQQRPGLSVDLVAGYRYQQLEDHLEADDALSFSGSQASFPAGSTVQQFDGFDTRNVFQGGVVGMSTSFQRERWSFETSLKIAVGGTHSRVAITGATATAVPGQAATLLPGGLLALPSNIGVYDSYQFSVVPELGLTLGFNFSPQLRATLGYEIIYWDSVARPGDQVDLNVDPRQLPPPAGGSSAQPAFQLHTSDYWAQGLNLGLDLRF